MHQEAIDALVRSLKSLQTSSNYSDLRIFCGDQVFSVHKAIICPRSDFFAKACIWGKDGQPKGEINLDPDDPKMVKLMIDYFYRFDYNDVVPSETPPDIKEYLPPNPDLPGEQAVDVSSGSTTIGVITESIDDNLNSRVSWDYGLTSKEKRRRQKQMLLEGTWDSRLTQEMIDTEMAVVPDPVFMPEPEPEPDSLQAFLENTVGSHSKSKTLRERKARLHDLTGGLDTDRIVVNAHVYALADRYGIGDLKLLAKAKFSAAAAQSWQSEAFVEAAHLAFANTPSADLGLRSVVVNTLYSHRELMDYEEVQDLLDSGNGIAWQFVQVLLSKQRYGWP